MRCLPSIYRCARGKSLLESWGYHFSSQLTSTLNLCLIYFKITWALVILLDHMHKKFEINRTKIKGGCQAGRKVVPHDSKSDLPLVICATENFSNVFCGAQRGPFSSSPSIGPHAPSGVLVFKWPLIGISSIWWSSSKLFVIMTWIAEKSSFPVRMCAWDDWKHVDAIWSYKKHLWDFFDCF